MDTQKKRPRIFSFEFFPPKDDGARATLRDAIAQLAQLRPKFFSVTFGAGGSTRAGTYETVKDIQAAGHAAAPHISGIASTRDQIRALLKSYRALGIRHLVVLRGDRPKDGVIHGEFRYANELVEFIRAEADKDFNIEVAAYPEFHPEAPTAEADLDNFARKVRAGANSAITQYFFNPDAYCRFVD